MGPRRPVTEPGSPGGSGARAAGCAAAGAAVRSWGSSWEAPRQHSPRMTHSRRRPPPLTPRAGRPGRWPWSSLCAPDARRSPGAAAGSQRRGGQGGARRGAGKATGPGRSRAAHPHSGAMAAPALRSARPWRWPGETPALKVGAARSIGADTYRSCRHVHPLWLGNSPPSLGHSSQPCT